MRTWLHLALWGAVFLGACSSGGPGGLISTQSVREAPPNSLESPGPGGGDSISLGESSNGNNNPQTTKDSGTGTPDVNVERPDVNVERPDGATVIEASTGDATAQYTCEDLQSCCDSLSGTEQTQCQLAADSTTSDSVCSGFLTSIKNAGRCQ